MHRMLIWLGSGEELEKGSDVSFPTLDALKASAASEGGKEALAHAASISSGGAPMFIVVTDAA